MPVTISPTVSKQVHPVQEAVTLEIIPILPVEAASLAETTITATGAAKELRAAVHSDRVILRLAAAAEALVRAHPAAVLLLLQAAQVAAQPEDVVTNTGS